MKNDPRNKCLTAFAILFAFAAAGQNQNIPSVYNDFDTTLRVKNAAFNNGKIHFNPYRSADKTIRYLLPEFIEGQIIFDGQPYGGVWLKYDVLGDALIVKFDGKGNKMGFSPVRQRTAAFYIGQTKFTNLDLVDHPAFVSGFYEEITLGNDTLYIKHYKDQFARLTNEQVFYTYADRDDFLLLHQKIFYTLNDKNDAIKAFPDFEEQIIGFFAENAPLEKSYRRKFMEKLALYIGELSNTATK